MKDKNSKSAIYFVIIYNLAILVFCLIAIISMFIIEKPNKLNKNDFIKVVETSECPIKDEKDIKENEGTSFYLTTDKKTCPYEITYMDFYDYDTKEGFLEYFSEDVLYENKNTKFTKKINLELFDSYNEYLTKGDQLKQMIYNEGTILYISAPIDYESEINHIIDKLDYKYKDNFNKTKKFLSLAFFLSLIVFVISMWGTLKKTRNKGWISLIPFYNIGCLTKDAMGSAWYVLLLFVPIGSTIFQYVFLYKLGKSFNKSDGYSVLLMFFPTVMWPLLAFKIFFYSTSNFLIDIPLVIPLITLLALSTVFLSGSITYNL